MFTSLTSKERPCCHLSSPYFLLCSTILEDISSIPHWYAIPLLAFPSTNSRITSKRKICQNHAQTSLLNTVLEPSPRAGCPRLYPGGFGTFNSPTGFYNQQPDKTYYRNTCNLCNRVTLSRQFKDSILSTKPAPHQERAVTTASPKLCPTPY